MRVQQRHENGCHGAPPSGVTAKSSNSTCESAFDQRPMRPEGTKSSVFSKRFCPSSVAETCCPLSSRASVCQVFDGVGTLRTSSTTVRLPLALRGSQNNCRWTQVQYRQMVEPKMTNHLALAPRPSWPPRSPFPAFSGARPRASRRASAAPASGAPRRSRGRALGARAHTRAARARTAFPHEDGQRAPHDGPWGTRVEPDVRAVPSRKVLGLKSWN